MERNQYIKHPLLSALGLNAIFLLVSIILGSGKYCSLDDFFMASVLTGAYGGGLDPHLYFVNVAFGYLLMPFYSLAPQVGWYGIFETLCMFVSFTAITFVILKQFDKKIGLTLSLLILSCVSCDFYLFVAFTQCAAALTAAGIVLFSRGMSWKNRACLYVGVALMLGGFIMRKEMFLLGIPVLGILVALDFFQNRKIQRQSLIALLVLVVAVVGLKVFDEQHYKTDGYDFYAAYQPVRAMFGDGAYYDSDAVFDEMSERGMIARDFRYLNSWYFYDRDVFSIDSLQPIIEIVKRNMFVPNYVKMPAAIIHAVSNNILRPVVWCWAFVCILLLLARSRDKIVLPWLSLFVLVLSYLYLLLVNRVVSHVESGIWMYATTMLVPFIDADVFHQGKRGEKMYLAVIVFSAIGVFLASVGIFFDKDSKKSELEVYDHTPNWGQFLEYAENHPDDVFLLPFDRYKHLAAITGRFYKATPPGSFQNIFSTGYWNIYLPAMERQMNKRGVQNMFRDIKNDNVFVLNEETSMSFVPFYSDHYHEILTIDTLRSFGDMFLLKYRSVRGKE